MSKLQDAFFGLCALLWVLAIVAFNTAIIYIVLHFIFKYW